MLNIKAHIYKTVNEEASLPCNARHLVSVSANPNSPPGGCSIVSVSFQLLGWIEGDTPEQFDWEYGINGGQVFTVNSCIDLDTLSYNCIGRIAFVWDDGIECCP